MNIKIFKKEIDLTNFFKFIGFVVGVIVSGILSIIMLSALGQNDFAVKLFGWGAAAIEFGKVFVAVMMVTALYCLKYYTRKSGGFSKKKRKTDELSTMYFTIAKDYLKAFIGSFIVYLFFVSSSLWATTNFGLTAMYLYDQRNKIAVVDTSTEELTQFKIDSEQRLIAQLIEMNGTDKKTIEGYEAYVATLTDEFPTKKADYMTRAKRLQKEIMERENIIREKNELIITYKQELATEKKDVAIQNKDQEKSAFDIAAIALSNKDRNVKPTTLMLILILFFAISLELVIDFCSPHTPIVNEEKDFLKTYGFEGWKRRNVLVEKLNLIEKAKLDKEAKKAMEKFVDKDPKIAYTEKEKKGKITSSKVIEEKPSVEEKIEEVFIEATPIIQNTIIEEPKLIIEEQKKPENFTLFSKGISFGSILGKSKILIDTKAKANNIQSKVLLEAMKTAIDNPDEDLYEQNETKVETRKKLVTLLETDKTDKTRVSKKAKGLVKDI